MKFPALLFAILVFITSFVASLPTPGDDALEARLENQVGTPVLITAVDEAADAGDSTFAAKTGDNKKAKHGKKGKGGKGGKKKDGMKKDVKKDGKKKDGKKDGKKKDGKKDGATGTAGKAA